MVTDSKKSSEVSPPFSLITSQPSTQSQAKTFKMLRLYKQSSEELGIIISKKRNPQKNTTGYEIAHIDPDGLIHR